MGEKEGLPAVREWKVYSRLGRDTHKGRDHIHTPGGPGSVHEAVERSDQGGSPRRGSIGP